MTIDKINIIGAGSLGSFQAFLLAKMSGVLGCQIKILDFDKVELRNKDNQLYRSQDVDRLKVEALKEILDPLTESNIQIVDHKVDEKTDLRGVLIVMVDSMAVRKNIFEAFRYDAGISYYIEARTGGNLALVYCFNPRNPDCIDRYQKTLYSDKAVENPRCAIAETVPVLWAVSSAIAGMLISLKNDKVNRDEFVEITINFSDIPLVKSESYQST